MLLKLTSSSDLFKNAEVSYSTESDLKSFLCEREPADADLFLVVFFLFACFASLLQMHFSQTHNSLLTPLFFCATSPISLHIAHFIHCRS